MLDSDATMLPALAPIWFSGQFTGGCITNAKANEASHDIRLLWLHGSTFFSHSIQDLSGRIADGVTCAAPGQLLKIFCKIREFESHFIYRGYLENEQIIWNLEDSVVVLPENSLWFWRDIGCKGGRRIDLLALPGDEAVGRPATRPRRPGFTIRSGAGSSFTFVAKN